MKNNNALAALADCMDLEDLQVCSIFYCNFWSMNSLGRAQALSLAKEIIQLPVLLHFTSSLAAAPGHAPNDGNI
jgi:hypothetical protein